MIELVEWKPCPFCGRMPSLWDVNENGRRSFEEYREETGKSVISVGCMPCGMSMVIVDEPMPFEVAVEEISKKWNRRTTE